MVPFLGIRSKCFHDIRRFRDQERSVSQNQPVMHDTPRQRPAVCLNELPLTLLERFMVWSLISTFASGCAVVAFDFCLVCIHGTRLENVIPKAVPETIK